MLLQNPQLAYALLQAQVVMKIIDAATAVSLLHPVNQVPATLMPGDKNVPVQVPISNQYREPPAPVQPPRQEFQPVPAPVIHPSQNQVFVGQDIDLRSIGAVPDLRLRPMGDQDMRQLPSAIQNPLPPTIGESILKQGDMKGDSFVRDPRGPQAFGGDPRQARIDPRQKTMVPPPAALPIPAPNARPVMPPQPQVPVTRPAPTPQPVPTPTPATASPNVANAGASDQEKAALIMQVLQLSDEQISMLPPEQRNSILVLKEQIAKSAHTR
ncbi:unnamed protein product [Diabrotica balteata]|uniref:Uncharacterized protein n=1 Tax=Diabrotica balteata TaxID=107213 RepID=A0A9N9SRP9_DIABA|nr:unnamed protein product [Diabrotica balteata]